MKYVLKLEALGLFTLFTTVYFQYYPNNLKFFLVLFFLPDIAFVLFILSKKVAILAYNTLHHQGILALLFTVGLLLHNDLIIKMSLIFLAHSSFDRIAGYGLKYFDNFDHTHLGWVGKNKHVNQ